MDETINFRKEKHKYHDQATQTVDQHSDEIKSLKQTITELKETITVLSSQKESIARNLRNDLACCDKQSTKATNELEVKNKELQATNAKLVEAETALSQLWTDHNLAMTRYEEKVFVQSIEKQLS